MPDNKWARLRIPTMPIANSNLMAIRIPIDADHHRSEATLNFIYHRERIDSESISSLVSGEWGEKAEGERPLGQRRSSGGNMVPRASWR
jgi:hypothetical protein